MPLLPDIHNPAAFPGRVELFLRAAGIAEIRRIHYIPESLARPLHKFLSPLCEGAALD
jgi:hypothetical protein